MWGPYISLICCVHYVASAFVFPLHAPRHTSKHVGTFISVDLEHRGPQVFRELYIGVPCHIEALA